MNTSNFRPGRSTEASNSGKSRDPVIRAWNSRISSTTSCLAVAVTYVAGGTGVPSRSRMKRSAYR